MEGTLLMDLVYCIAPSRWPWLRTQDLIHAQMHPAQCSDLVASKVH